MSKYPLPLSFTDAIDGNQNKTATPGSIGKLKGKRLKFDADDTEQGVFFISCLAPFISIRATIYSCVMPSTVHFQIPQLPIGEYRIKIKCISRSKKRIIDVTLQSKDYLTRLRIDSNLKVP